MSEQAFEHNGTLIAPANIIKRGETKPTLMWLVQTDENKRRRARGERSVAGDRLVDTKEEAIAVAEAEQKENLKRAAALQKLADEEATAAAAKAAVAADDYGGFLAGKAENVKALARKALAKQYRFDGVVMSARERIESLAESGALSVSTYEEQKIKPMSRRQFHRANNEEQRAHEKKMLEAGTKTEYLVSDSVLGKTAFDYAEYLLRR